MNKQEIFDRVAAHLMQQGRVSVREREESCAYRGAGGARCAVGLLIPDDLYDADMEGSRAGYILTVWPKLGDLLDVRLNGNLLDELQHIHDDAIVLDPALPSIRLLRKWEAGLRECAERHDLHTAALEHPIVLDAMSPPA